MIIIINLYILFCSFNSIYLKTNNKNCRKKNIDNYKYNLTKNLRISTYYLAYNYLKILLPYNRMNSNTPSIKNFNIKNLLFSIIGIFYVWTLPILAEFNFAEKNSHSISQFISNPQATGAMAAVSFYPISIMWEYQDMYIKCLRPELINNNFLDITITLFQISYGGFLICSVSYAPIWLHTTMVIIFCTSFIVHSLYINHYINLNRVTKIILFIGCMSFIFLPFQHGMWFWAFECIGFSSMLLFTPIDWYLLNKKLSGNFQPLTTI